MYDNDVCSGDTSVSGIRGLLADPRGWSFEALGAYVESLTCVAAPSWLWVVLVGAQHLCVL